MSGDRDVLCEPSYIGCIGSNFTNKLDTVHMRNPELLSYDYSEQYTMHSYVYTYAHCITTEKAPTDSSGRMNPL